MNTGDHVPNFALPDQEGKPWIPSEQLRRRPAVLVFYRGDWCPYCNGQLVSQFTGAPEVEARLLVVSLEGALLVARSYADVDRYRLAEMLLADREMPMRQLTRAQPFLPP